MMRQGETERMDYCGAGAVEDIYGGADCGWCKLRLPPALNATLGLGPGVAFECVVCKRGGTRGLKVVALACRTRL
jgi:hypothetical protein